MKRFGKVALLVCALYAATILVASFHDHQANSEHLKCKLCQISFESADRAVQVQAICESRDFGLLPKFELSRDWLEIANVISTRAPPTIS
jgi:hypothetical protein